MAKQNFLNAGSDNDAYTVQLIKLTQNILEENSKLNDRVQKMELDLRDLMNKRFSELSEKLNNCQLNESLRIGDNKADIKVLKVKTGLMSSLVSVLTTIAANLVFFWALWSKFNK